MKISPNKNSSGNFPSTSLRNHAAEFESFGIKRSGLAMMAYERLFFRNSKSNIIDTVFLDGIDGEFSYSIDWFKVRVKMEVMDV